MNSKLSLFLISILPVVLIGLYIYKKDKDKEPIKLLIKLFLYGILSCVLAVILELSFDYIFMLLFGENNDNNLVLLFIEVFVGIAFMEEFSKWIVVYRLAYNNEHFDEIYDMIIYCVFVSLGFAGIENILYVFQNGFSVGIIRALLSVPGHAFFGLFMGYYLGLSKYELLHNNERMQKKYYNLSIIIPTILHGVFDYCLLTGKIIFLVIFGIFIIFMYVYSILKIKKVLNANQKLKYQLLFCPRCGMKVESEYCPKCGMRNY